MLKNTLFSSPAVSDKLIEAVKGVVINESNEAQKHRENLKDIVRAAKHHFGKMTSSSNQTDAFRTDREVRLYHANHLHDLHQQFHEAALMARNHLHPNELDEFSRKLRKNSGDYTQSEFHGLAQAHARKHNK